MACVLFSLDIDLKWWELQRCVLNRVRKNIYHEGFLGERAEGWTGLVLTCDGWYKPVGKERWKIPARQGLSPHCFAYKLHKLFVSLLGKLCTHVYNLVKESALAMMLLNTQVHSGGYGNSTVLLLKIIFLSDLPRRKTPFSTYRIKKRPALSCPQRLVWHHSCPPRTRSQQ